MSDPVPPNSTSLHEAGHAVVGLLLGLPVTDITGEIEEWGLLGSFGLSLPPDYSATKYPDLSRPRITTALAGIAVEERVSGQVDVAGARVDLEIAFNLADALSGDTALATIRACQDEARGLVAEHWWRIEAVARALDASAGTLEVDELRRVADLTESK